MDVEPNKRVSHTQGRLLMRGFYAICLTPRFCSTGRCGLEPYGYLQIHWRLLLYYSMSEAGTMRSHQMGNSELFEVGPFSIGGKRCYHRVRTAETVLVNQSGTAGLES